MSEFIYDKNEILKQTNGGLEVIKHLYPNEKLFSGGSEKKPTHFNVGFCVEETPSFIIVPNTLGSDCVVVKSFKTGDTYTCFSLVMEEHGKNFGEACKWIAESIGLTLKGYTAKKGDFEFKDATPDQKVGETYIEYNKEVSAKELAVLGPLVGENEIEIFKIRSAKSVTKIKQYTNHAKHGTCKKQLVTVATEDYPILIYDYGTWQKIYQPFGKYTKTDKNGKTTKVDVRFSYAGKKPDNYVFGLDSLIDYYHDEWKLNHYDDEKETYEKFKNVIIAGGDRDGLNISSLGYPVIWLNSETAKLDYKTYKLLLEIADNVCYCGDLDLTGVKETIKLALDFIHIKIIWLPNWIKAKKGKDVTDFTKFSYKEENPDFVKNQFTSLVYTALPARFWEEKKTKDGKVKGYDINNEALVKFLNYNGFYLYEDENAKDDYEFIRVENGVFERIKPHQIVNFPLQFAQNKLLPIALRNAIHRSPQISDKRLSKLGKIKPTFINSERNFQRLFFENEVITVGKDAITKHSYKYNTNNVWKDAIIPHHITLAKNKSFKIFKNQQGAWDIDIYAKDNHFLNYLINTSRIHWRVCGNDPYDTQINAIKENDLEPEEESKQIKEVLKKRNAYRKENKFNLTEKGLTPAQIAEQKLSLINKIFAWGYLLHEKKLDDKAWAVFAMDNRVSEIGESNGGSGKSIMFDKAVKYIVRNYKYINGGNKKLIESDFLFDGVDATTNYVVFDDLDSRFPFRSVYANITGEFVVNPKGTKAFNLLFHESPKIAFTSNFGLYSPDDSTLRRLLIVPFSDYYHKKSDNNYEDYSPNDDFGKNLFTEFTKEEDNDYFNLAFEAIQFFLNTTTKIEAPNDNVEKRNALQTIGTDFKEWADGYFIHEERINDFIIKTTANEDCNSKLKKTLSSHFFKKKLQEWCKYHGFIYCPPSKDYTTTVSKTGAVSIRKSMEGTTQEILFLKSPAKARIIKDNVQKIAQAAQDDDDMPF